MKYTIVEGSGNIDMQQLMLLLKQTYWANRRSEEQVRKSVENSCCYSVYLEDAQKLVGFARVISDFATTYYLCDVIVDQDHRGKGLGKALVSYIENRPEYQGMRGILITKNAHTLYEQFGYQTIDGRAMVKGLNC